jgi:hypothetical protein
VFLRRIPYAHGCLCHIFYSTGLPQQNLVDFVCQALGIISLEAYRDFKSSRSDGQWQNEV